MAEVLAVKKRAGVAGQYSFVATVRYEGEPASSVEFVGSVYGGPVVMALESGAQVFVSREVMTRLGEKLTEEWVRGFFGEHGPECTACVHDCPWRQHHFGAPFCSVCDDHYEAAGEAE